jgi:hypothetical protein
MSEDAGRTHIPETACPSLEELVRFDEAESSVVEHVAGCLRCQARLAALRTTTAAGEPFALPEPEGDRAALNTPHRVRPDTRLEFGVICSVASDERPGERLLAVIVGGKPVKDPLADGPVTVAPISLDREYASRLDALIGDGELDLGYDCMVEIWNYGRVARVQLDETFGRVHPASKRRLAALWKAMRSGEGAPQGMLVGPPILSEDDPRVGFQRDEIERVRPFYTPHVTSLRELAGSLVRLLQERAAVVTFEEPESGTPEADVLTAVRRNGFIVPPEANALGHVIKLLRFDVTPGTVGGSALEEEASAWIENERREPAQMAARGPLERARDAVGRIIPALASNRAADETAAYIDVVRAAASAGGRSQ